MSNLAETLAEFQKQGCRLIGMTEVNTRFDDWEFGQRGIAPALEIEVLPA